MGTVRTLLAFSVVLAHSYGFVLVGGMLAVELFYIISGFLISYVLVETNTYSSAKRFYLNRFFRIFPIYWTVAILSLIFVFIMFVYYGLNHPVLIVYSRIDSTGKIALNLANLFLFGQDWIMFTGVKNGVFQFVENSHITELQTFRGLIVPQAWTLGLELSFYLLAPFILRSKLILYISLAVSVGVRIVLFRLGLASTDPWTYRFFPAELAFFILGSWAHQVLMPFLKKRNYLTRRNATMFTMLIVFYCAIFFILDFRTMHSIILITLFIFALPFLFTFQKEISWDSRIGELSYPIYICHMLVIWIVWTTIAGKSIPAKSITAIAIIIVMTLISSFLLNRFVAKKFNDLRKRVKSGDKLVEIMRGKESNWKLGISS